MHGFRFSSLVRLLTAIMAAVFLASATVAKGDDTASQNPDEPSRAAADTSAAKSHKIRFQFRFQPWKDVLDWFAQQADMALVMDSPPPGTFNYTDNHYYTPTEAIDLLNGVLLTKGYTLIRRGRMLMLINLEDGIPPNLVSTVPLESLDSLGKYELVRVLFNVDKLKPEEAAAEINKLLGPQGSVVSLPKSRQVYVTETVGRLRAIGKMLQRIDGPAGLGSAGFRTFELKHTQPENVLPVLHQLLDIPEDKNASSDGSIRIAVEWGGRLLVSGQPEKVAQAATIIQGLDVPASGDEGGNRLIGSPQLEVYPVSGIDPQSALAVLETLLAGQPELRLSIDAKSGNLIAFARPAQQATIRATLAQLQGEGQRIEVVRLVRNDPQSVATAIGKLFGTSDEEENKGVFPQVEADVANWQLIIRGSEAQIAQIRGMLEQMGEPLRPRGGQAASGDRVRKIPYGGSSARSALERIQEIWPTLRSNKIRVVRPSANDEHPSRGHGEEELPPELFDRFSRPVQPLEENHPAPGPSKNQQPPPPLQPSSDDERLTAIHDGFNMFFVSDDVETQPSREMAQPPVKPQSSANTESPPIVVVPGTNGLIIASEDTEALDEFESLLDEIMRGFANTRGVTVFYLRHAKAAVVAETLTQIMGGATSAYTGESASRQNNQPGNFGPFGGFGGFGVPSFGGRRRPRDSERNESESSASSTATANTQAQQGVLATGSVRITADQRLNALLVQANRADLDSIEELLTILDKRESPEDVALAPKPRMIPVQYTSAEEVADVVKQVYAGRMVEGANANARPNMAAFMAQMSRGRNRGNQQQQTNSPEVAKMSIGVDVRTNSLIVSAPDTLFEEVRQLVEQLDVGAGDQNETVRVVALHNSSPEAVEQALLAIAGESVQVNRSSVQSSRWMGNSSQRGQYQREGRYNQQQGSRRGYNQSYGRQNTGRQSSQYNRQYYGRGNSQSSQRGGQGTQRGRRSNQNQRSPRG